MSPGMGRASQMINTIFLKNCISKQIILQEKGWDSTPGVQGWGKLGRHSGGNGQCNAMTEQ